MTTLMIDVELYHRLPYEVRQPLDRWLERLSGHPLPGVYRLRGAEPPRLSVLAIEWDGEDCTIEAWAAGSDGDLLVVDDKVSTVRLRPPVFPPPELIRYAKDRFGERLSD